MIQSFGKYFNCVHLYTSCRAGPLPIDNASFHDMVSWAYRVTGSFLVLVDSSAFIRFSNHLNLFRNVNRKQNNRNRLIGLLCVLSLPPLLFFPGAPCLAGLTGGYFFKFGVFQDHRPMANVFPPLAVMRLSPSDDVTSFSCNLKFSARIVASVKSPSLHRLLSVGQGCDFSDPGFAIFPQRYEP